MKIVHSGDHCVQMSLSKGLAVGVVEMADQFFVKSALRTSGRATCTRVRLGRTGWADIFDLATDEHR